MVEATHKAEDLTARATSLPTLFGTMFVEGAESVIHAQADLLADVEETLTTSLRSHQEALRKVLEAIGEARTGNTLADQMRLHLAASEQYINSSLSLWRDATTLWSQRTLKRLESGRKTMLASAAATSDHERPTSWGFAEKSTSGKSNARRHAAEAA